MKPLEKAFFVLAATAVMPLLTAGRAHAWAGHTVISEALGAGDAGVTSDVPDTWGEDHLGRELLAGKVQYWAAKAKALPRCGPYKAVYTGYALHYLEDAGQPWHIYRGSGIPDGIWDGNNGLHMKFELHAAKRYLSYTEAIAEGARSPVAITGDTDAYNKTVALAEAVNDLYPYMDSEENWNANSEYIKKALRQVGRYGAGLVRYIQIPPAGVKDDSCSDKAKSLIDKTAEAWRTSAPKRLTGTGLDILAPTGIGTGGGIASLKNGDPALSRDKSAPPEPEAVAAEPRKKSFFGGILDGIFGFFRKR